MIEGFTTKECADFADALCRRKLAWSQKPQPFRQPLPWQTLSGFADSDYFFAALARSWPMIPATGDLIGLQKIFPWYNSAIINPQLCKAMPEP